MKILFIWFNFQCQSFGMNIGVSILSRELEEAGHDVRVMHISETLGYGFDVDRIVADSQQFVPDIFCLSFGSNHYRPAMTLAQKLKEEFPQSWIVCGGIHATLNPESVIQHPWVDAVGVGEVDQNHLVHFVERLSSGKDYERFPNFLVRVNGDIYRNPVLFLPDIKRQTFLNFKRIDYKTITTLRRGFAEVLSSRGCPYSCTYCQNHALVSVYKKDMESFQYIRQRDISNLIEELKEFLQSMGDVLKAFVFADDAFIMNKSWIKAFTQRYKEEINVPFSCCGLVRSIDEEIVERLAGANCMIVRFGIETGSDKTRKEILNKPIVNSQFESAVKLLHAGGINVGSYVMLGIPGETSQDICNTFSFLSKIQPDEVRCSIFYPFEGTILYDYCVEQKLLNKGTSLTSYNFHSVLKLNDEMGFFVEKINVLFPLILNRNIGSAEAKEYEMLLQKAFSMNRKEWSAPGTRAWIHDESRRLSEVLMQKGKEHYYVPFPDRPDAAFLFRERKNKLVNIGQRN